MVFNHIKGHDCFFSRGISAKTRVPDWIHFNFDPQNDVQCDKTYYVFFSICPVHFGICDIYDFCCGYTSGAMHRFLFSFFLTWDLPTMALQPAVGFGLKPWLLKLWTNAKTRRFGKGRVGCIWILGPCLPPSYLAQNHTSLMESIYIYIYQSLQAT